MVSEAVIEVAMAHGATNSEEFKCSAPYRQETVLIKNACCILACGNPYFFDRKSRGLKKPISYVVLIVNTF